MMFEILKNSLRAVVDKHGVDCDSFPTVKVIVAEGNEDITIKISDEGGGIPRSAVPLVWTFMYVCSPAGSLLTERAGTRLLLRRTSIRISREPTSRRPWPVSVRAPPLPCSTDWCRVWTAYRASLLAVLWREPQAHLDGRVRPSHPLLR